MNVTEASIKLFTWFSEHDTFEMEKDFIPLVLVTDKEAHDKAAIECALKSLEEGNLINSSKVSEREIWVLQKPFSSFTQNVELNPELATAISTVINEFCEMIGDNTDLCDPSSVSTKDIQNIVFLYRHVQDKLASGEEGGKES